MTKFIEPTVFHNSFAGCVAFTKATKSSSQGLMSEVRQWADP